MFQFLFFPQDEEEDQETGKAEKVEKKDKKEKGEKDDKPGKAEKGEKKAKEKKDKKEKKDEKVKATALQRDQERAKGLQLEEAEEEEPTDSKEDKKEESKRGPRKAWFFNKNYDMLPQAAKDLFDSKKVSRNEKPDLVNSMVQKSSSGKWFLDTESPVLTALSRHFKSLVGEESLVSRVSTFLFFNCIPSKVLLPKFGLEDSKNH